MTETYDIAVVGGGNAALCAAITAAEAGARVIILEGAPEPYRGGNSRHTRNFRCMHRGPMFPLTGSYEEEEYFHDLMLVTKGKTDEHLARLAIRTSEECLPWMQSHGVRFQPSLSGTLSLSRTNAFFLGGGKALVNAYYNTATDLGIDIRYEARSAMSVARASGSRIWRSRSPAPLRRRSMRAPSCWPRAGSRRIWTGWRGPGAPRRATS